MAISIEEYDKLCEAEKYFHAIYDSWRSFFSIEKRIDGKWYLFHRLTSAEYHAGCGTHSEDYGSYSSKEAAQYDKEQMMRQHACTTTWTTRNSTRKRLTYRRQNERLYGTPIEG